MPNRLYIALTLAVLTALPVFGGDNAEKENIAFSNTPTLAPKMSRPALRHRIAAPQMETPHSPTTTAVTAEKPAQAEAATDASSERGEEVAIKNEGDFSNACTPPKDEKKKNPVPKTLHALRAQVGEGFHTARRGPFLIASDLEDEEFCTLVDGVLACCRESLSRDYFRQSPKKIITIYVFKSIDSYNTGLKKHFNMKPISPYGHYGYSQRYIVINYDTGPGTLVHELTHALMAPDFPLAPIWISEGMASLYEQCRVEGQSLKGDDNWRLPELLDACVNNHVTPLSSLLAMPSADFRTKRESLHYAESRYFCKFMEERGMLRKVYRMFRDGYSKDTTGITFIEKAFGKPLAEVEEEWHTWLRSRKRK